MIKKLLVKYRETISYLIFGILAVVVNTVSYLALSLVFTDLAANTLAFLLTILFAYWTNTCFVFRVKHTWAKYLSFTAMRLLTLPVDDLGLLTLLYIDVDPLLAKTIMNTILIAINYLMSKFLIFKKRN